jgi:hypothetical protein
MAPMRKQMIKERSPSMKLSSTSLIEVSPTQRQPAARQAQVPRDAPDETYDEEDMGDLNEEEGVANTVERNTAANKAPDTCFSERLEKTRGGIIHRKNEDMPLSGRKSARVQDISSELLSIIDAKLLNEPDDEAI